MSKTTAKITEEDKPTCGIVMPISTIDGYPTNHWGDVFDILKDCITVAGFKPDLVSDSNVSGIIQKRIIQNLYNNPIVVCDVSGKNPNVMFELGVRLAFDKPTIIIKDDVTDYSFDTSIIEHIPYPRELRFSKIVEFKEKLKTKIQGTYKASKDQNYSTFLKHFGEFKVAQLSESEVSPNEYLNKTLQEFRSEMTQFLRERNDGPPKIVTPIDSNSNWGAIWGDVGRTSHKCSNCGKTYLIQTPAIEVSIVGREKTISCPYCGNIEPYNAFNF